MSRHPFVVFTDCALIAATAVAIVAPLRAAGADDPIVPAHVHRARAAGTPPAALQPAAAAQPAAAGRPDEDERDRDVNLAQPDFALAALPTTLRLPPRALSFRMTHRFNEPIADAGLEGLFGLDAGATIGIEFRVGLTRGWQAIVHRTSDRTIQFSTHYEVVRQGTRMPVGITALAGVEGADNFRDAYAPAVGGIVSREFGSRAAAYLAPVWVGRTHAHPGSPDGGPSNLLAGAGARVRVLASTYLVAEVVPRVAGHAEGVTQAAFGIEKRAGGHLFQLTFANGPGTTWAQMARGGRPGRDWYLGFNLSRKFY